MPRENASRKWLLTINNPLEHGYPHEQIKKNLSELKGLKYWCMSDEIGQEGTPHTHIYLYADNAIMFSTIHKRFYGAHIDKANGTSQECRDYIRKEGKYFDSSKKETNLSETFEEWGKMPIERQKSQKQMEAIMEMIKDGATDAEILGVFAFAFTKLSHIEKARQTWLEAKYRNEWRTLEITYIHGKTRTGKTRYVMEKYGYSNVYKVTNYQHPFDGYNGEDVLLLDEFRSSIPFSELLQILDGYPCKLAARYADKVACFTKVYIVTNIPFEEQYPNIKRDEPDSWEALRARINHFIEFKAEDSMEEYEVVDIPDDWR